MGKLARDSPRVGLCFIGACQQVASGLGGTNCLDADLAVARPLCTGMLNIRGSEYPCSRSVVLWSSGMKYVMLSIHSPRWPSARGRLPCIGYLAGPGSRIPTTVLRS